MLVLLIYAREFLEVCNTELIENGDFVRHINRVRRKRREERKLR